jgi:hypothetical protein
MLPFPVGGKQVVLGWRLKVRLMGGLLLGMLMSKEALHPFAPVTVTLYVPAICPVMDEPVPPLDHA